MCIKFIGHGNFCACLPDAKARAAVSPEHGLPDGSEVGSPRVAVALANHVHAVQQHQPGLGAAPARHRRVRRRRRDAVRRAHD